MAELSNRVLAGLLIVAIVVSLGGTLLSLNRISKQIPFIPVTGYASNDATGYANLSIYGVLSVAILNSTIDFGTGYTEPDLNCTMWINGTKGAHDLYSDAATCGYNWDSTVWEVSGETPIIIENDGTTYINVSVQSNATDSEFLPRIGSAGSFGNSGRIEQWYVNNETGSCNDTRYYHNGKDPIGNWTNVTKSAAAPTIACVCLNATDTKDSMAMGLRVELPSDLDIPPGKNHYIKFNVTARAMGSPGTDPC